jgi:hypothetical protein
MKYAFSRAVKFFFDLRLDKLENSYFERQFGFRSDSTSKIFFNQPRPVSAELFRRRFAGRHQQHGVV